MVVSKKVFQEHNSWNGAWHVIYDWKALPLGSMISYTVYNELAHKNVNKLENNNLFKNRDGGGWNWTIPSCI